MSNHEPDGRIYKQNLHAAVMSREHFPRYWLFWGEGTFVTDRWLHPTQVTWEIYRKQRNLTTAINKQSKATYFRERCDGGPKKQKFWRTIKPFITDKNAFHCNKIILQEGDKIVTDTQEICEIFNAFFTSVANNIGFDDTIPSDYYTDEGFSAIIKRHSNHPSITKIMENNEHNSIFQFQCINKFDVVNIINCFDSKKAQGYDMMPMKMLQKSAKYIAPAIVKLINDSMSKCVFPDSLKFAEVSSLFKKKDALIKTNYRPVSTLVALSKIYEKALGVQLTDYFNAIFFQIYFQLFERVIVASQPC